VSNTAPPIPAADIRDGIIRVFESGDFPVEALKRLAVEAPAHWAEHLDLEHSVPGPSSVLSCRRAMWYQTHEVEKDSTPPAWWAYNATVGTLQELIWCAALEAVDPRLRVELFEKPLGETITNINADTASEKYVLRGTPDGRLPEVAAITEFKKINNYGFKMVRDSGVYHGKEEHYAQCQIYMLLAGVEWCLYIAAAQDPSKVSPWFVVEWIQADKDYLFWAIRKFVDGSRAVAMPTVAPRDFDPAKGKFPCGSERKAYCPWRTQCVKDG